MKTIKPAVKARILSFYQATQGPIEVKAPQNMSTDDVSAIMEDFCDPEQEYRVVKTERNDLYTVHRLKDNEGKKYWLEIWNDGTLTVGTFELDLPFSDGDSVEVSVASTMYLQAYQYLYFRAYALPYGEYSIQDLIDAGIFELITT